MTHKFETGSQWKTRGGWRAVVVDVSKDGLTVWHESNNTRHHALNGETTSEMHALVEPWAEPIKRTFWVNVYEDYLYGICTPQEAENHASFITAIDNIQIDYVQGKTHYVAKGE